MKPRRTTRTLRTSLLALVVLSMAALVTSTGLLTSTAWAHDLPQERTVLVQISEDRVEVMLIFLEPPGTRADLMFERFDLNRDGELRGSEAMLAGGEWIGRALDGLQFEVSGEAPRARAPEIKFRREKKGALSAAVYARWDLEKLAPGTSRTVHVRMLRQPKNVATEVTFQAAPGLKLTDVDLPDRLRQKGARPVLDAGEQATASVERPISASPSPAK